LRFGKVPNCKLCKLLDFGNSEWCKELLPFGSTTHTENYNEMEGGDSESSNWKQASVKMKIYGKVLN
jgi:hypothetical protein